MTNDEMRIIEAAIDKGIDEAREAARPVSGAGRSIRRPWRPGRSAGFIVYHAAMRALSPPRRRRTPPWSIAPGAWS
jgi:hypothetical protein